MRYLFILVFLLFSTSSSLFAGQFESLIKCSPNRWGREVMNCKKGEDCSSKKVLYDKDIMCGIAKVFKISEEQFYENPLRLPKDGKTSYIFYQFLEAKLYKEDRVIKKLRQNKVLKEYLDQFARKLSYFEVSNGELGSVNII